MHQICLVLMASTEIEPVERTTGYVNFSLPCLRGRLLHCCEATVTLKR